MIILAKQLLVSMTMLHYVEDEWQQSYTAFKPMRASYIDQLKSVRHDESDR